MKEEGGKDRVNIESEHEGATQCIQLVRNSSYVESFTSFVSWFYIYSKGRVGSSRMRNVFQLLLTSVMWNLPVMPDIAQLFAQYCLTN